MRSRTGRTTRCTARSPDDDPLSGVSETPGNDNEFAVYNAVQCTDVQWPTEVEPVEQGQRRVNKKYPFLTWGNAWFNAPCLYWGEGHARR